MDIETTEVLIVGAGPTGLTLLCALRQLGIPAIAVDVQAAGANTSRAAVVHARTLEVLEPLGVTKRLLSQGLQVPLFTVRDRNQVLTSISFRDLPTKYPFTLMCPQNRTEAVLSERVAELGADVRRPLELASFQENGDGVQATLRAADGRLSTIQARWLVGCDGSHSVVREQAGIDFEGGSYQETFVLADIEMDWPLGKEEGCMFLSPAGLMLVVPLPGDHFRIVATVDHAEAQPSLEDIQKILDERGPEGHIARITRCAWSSRFHIHHRVAQQFRKGRVLLAGDAAHVHSPAGGQGMNTGIQDSASLAEALRSVYNDQDETALDQWEHERLRIVRRVVAMTDRMTRAATLSSPVGMKIRNAVISWLGHTDFVSHALAARLAELEH